MTARFAALLAADERERARRFAFENLRASFALARGAMRILLGRCLDVTPESIVFAYGAKGKPGIASPTRVRFNASHSGELALFAATLDCELGVDIEHHRPLPDLEMIAQRFFSAEEIADLLALPADQRQAGFFRCWTRKEAYIKAIGDGLSVPLDSFAVSLRAEEPPRMTQLGGDPAAAAAWTLHNLDVAPEYMAALAYRATPRAIRLERILDPAELLRP